MIWLVVNRDQLVPWSEYHEPQYSTEVLNASLVQPGKKDLFLLEESAHAPPEKIEALRISHFLIIFLRWTAFLDRAFQQQEENATMAIKL